MPDAAVLASVDAIVAATKATLKTAGFRKYGRTWRRPGDEVTAIVNLQGSQWSRRFYVNLGVYVHGVDDQEKSDPSSGDCHINQRLCELVPSPIEFEKAIDAQSGLNDLIRTSRVQVALEEVALPFLDSLSTKDSIKAALESPAGRLYPTWRLQVFLGVA